MFSVFYKSNNYLKSWNFDKCLYFIMIKDRSYSIKNNYLMIPKEIFTALAFFVPYLRFYFIGLISFEYIMTSTVKYEIVKKILLRWAYWSIFRSKRIGIPMLQIDQNFCLWNLITKYPAVFPQCCAEYFVQRWSCQWSMKCSHKGIGWGNVFLPVLRVMW